MKLACAILLGVVHRRSQRHRAPRACRWLGFANDREAYTEGKTDFVRSVLAAV